MQDPKNVESYSNLEETRNFKLEKDLHFRNPPRNLKFQIRKI